MPVITIVVIFLAFTFAFWLVYRYSPEPLRTPLLWFISVILVLWLLYVTGIWAWMANAKV